jgi:hypothetical protein
MLANCVMLAKAYTQAMLEQQLSHTSLVGTHTTGASLAFRHSVGKNMHPYTYITATVVHAERIHAASAAFQSL